MWTVTRQVQWPEGDNVVEVSDGGIDYTNPDALCAKYPGEFQEFDDPREAVETAIEIAHSWQTDSGEEVSVGYGATGGMTMPFDKSSEQDARDWAKEAWDKADKCDCCGEIMPDNERNHWENENSRWTGDKFCSEYCAEKDWENSLTEEDREALLAGLYY